MPTDVKARPQLEANQIVFRQLSLDYSSPLRPGPVLGVPFVCDACTAVRKVLTNRRSVFRLERSIKLQKAWADDGNTLITLIPIQKRLVSKCFLCVSQVRLPEMRGPVSCRGLCVLNDVLYARKTDSSACINYGLAFLMSRCLPIFEAMAPHSSPYVKQRQNR